MQNYYPSWLNASYYQNIPHNEVNWAQLAQQWITMRDHHPPPIPTESHPSQPDPPPPDPNMFPAAAPFMRDVNQSAPIAKPPFVAQRPPPQQFLQQPAEQPPPPVAAFSEENYKAANVPNNANLAGLVKGFSGPMPIFPRRPLQPNIPIAHFGGGLLPTPNYPPRFRAQFNNPVPQGNLGGPLKLGNDTFGNFRPLARAGNIQPRPLFPVAHPAAIRHPHQEYNRIFEQEEKESYESLYNEEEEHYDNQTVDQYGVEEVYPSCETEYEESWQPPVANNLFGSQAPQSLLKNPLPVGPPQMYHPYYDTTSSAMYDQYAVMGGDEMSFLDMQQRQKLPAWIREGLEKVDKEKLKQKEKEEQEKLEKEKGQKRMSSGKGRFESDSEEEEDSKLNAVERNNDTSETLPQQVDKNGPTIDNNSSDEEEVGEEEKRAMLLAKLRVWLTEILMAVTTGEIQKIAGEVYKKKKKRAQPQVLAQSSAALATIINFGSDENDDEIGQSGTDNDTSDQSEDDGETAYFSNGKISAVDSPDEGAESSPGSPYSSSPSNTNDNDPFKRPLLPPVKPPAATSYMSVKVAGSEPKNTKDENKATFQDTETLEDGAKFKSEQREKQDGMEKEKHLSSSESRKRRGSRSKSRDKDKKSSSNSNTHSTNKSKRSKKSRSRSKERKKSTHDDDNLTSGKSHGSRSRESKSSADKHKDKSGRKRLSNSPVNNKDLKHQKDGLKSSSSTNKNRRSRSKGKEKSGSKRNSTSSGSHRKDKKKSESPNNDKDNRDGRGSYSNHKSRNDSPKSSRKRSKSRSPIRRSDSIDKSKDHRSRRSRS